MTASPFVFAALAMLGFGSGTSGSMSNEEKDVTPVEERDWLDRLDKFVELLQILKPGYSYRNVGELHCPTCGDTRRMDVSVKHKGSDYNVQPPTLVVMTCVQCDTGFTGLVYDGPEGMSLAVLPSTFGGLTTPHTPVGVAYYLDQAQRSQSVGANSAALAMFRGALEHLLFDQGFKKGMCGQKLAELEAAVNANTAPKWAYELDAEFLTVVKKLGDGAIHPNDGNIGEQYKLDNELLAHVSHTFQMLLYLIYEVPHQKQKRLDALKAGIIKK